MERERRGETEGKGKRKIKELNAKYRVKKRKEHNQHVKNESRRRSQRRRKLMNKGFQNLGKTNYFKSARDRCTKT